MRRIVLLIQAITGLFSKARQAIRRFDKRMHERYEPGRLTLVTLALIALVILFLLFVPPYMGLSDDGSFSSVLQDVGLERIDPSDSTAYFNYYERTYLFTERVIGQSYTTPVVLRTVIRAAMLLDQAITGDLLFDMRFLAGIYAVLYLGVLYPFIRFLLGHVRSYSGGLLVCFLGVLAFSDATLITRMASFYSQPLEWILMILILDCVIVLARNRGNSVGPLLLGGSCMLHMNINKYCASCGIVFSLLYWVLMSADKDAFHRLGYSAMALALVAFSVVSFGGLINTQTRSEKYDQMTRGVLFEAENPEKALAQFGIDSRYSILTETYADQSYPIVDITGIALDVGFFDQYDTGDILIYYLKNPLALLSLLDNGVHSAFTIQSEYSGNYEKSLGLPAKAKSVFPVLWSTYKTQSAPRTIGTIIVLVGVLVFITRKRRDVKLTEDQEQYRYLLNAGFYVYLTFSLAELATVIVMSGDSQLLRESSLMGGTIDILAVWFLASVMKTSTQYQEEK